MLFTALKISGKSWDKAETKLKHANEISSVQTFFHNQLASALPLWDDFSEKDKQFSFQGTEHTLQFVSTLPASSKRLGLQYFKIRLKNNKIKVTIKPFYPTLVYQQWTTEEVTLVDEIASFTLAYFGIEKIKATAQWQTEWLYPHLPQLVAIDISSLKDHDWPKIILKLNNQASQPQKNLFERTLKRFNQKRNEGATIEKNNAF